MVIRETKGADRVSGRKGTVMEYIYKAINDIGVPEIGKIRANSEKEVAETLVKDKWHPIDISKGGIFHLPNWCSFKSWFSYEMQKIIDKNNKELIEKMLPKFLEKAKENNISEEELRIELQKINMTTRRYTEDDVCFIIDSCMEDIIARKYEQEMIQKGYVKYEGEWKSKEEIEILKEKSSINPYSRYEFKNGDGHVFLVVKGERLILSYHRPIKTKGLWLWQGKVYFENPISLYKEVRKYNEEELRERRIPSRIRREVWRRDGGKCVKCNSRENLEYHYIIPFSKGGSNTARNIELLCEKCNRELKNNI